MSIRWRSRLFAALALMAVVVMVVTACGGDDDEDTPPTATSGPAATATPRPAATAAPTSAAPTATAAVLPTATPRPTVLPTVAPTATPAGARPVRGGTYSVRLQSDVVQGLSWDPHLSSGHVQIKAMPNVFSTLLMLDELDHQTVKGDLAESWSIAPDGQTYTVKLLKGVTYHDGSPLTAKDVIFSHKRLTGEIALTPPSPHVSAFRPYIDIMEMPDDFTVIFRLKQPSAAFIYSLAFLFAAIHPEKMGSPYAMNPANTPIGTGPFKWIERKPNISITMRRNDSYFKKDKDGQALPYLAELDFQVINDGTTAFAAFRTGKFLEADYLDPGLLNTSIDQTKREFPNYIFETGYGSWRQIGFRNKPPYDNVKIRQALDLLVDRPGFVTARYPGYGHAGASPLLPPSLRGRWGLTDQETSTLINTGPVTPQIIQRARQLFVEAGVDYDKFEVKLMTLPIPLYTDDAAFIQSAWKKAGLNVTLEVPAQADYSVRRIAGNFDVYYVPATSNTDDPDLVLGQWYPTGASQNYGKFSNAKIDQLYNDQSRAVDPARRKTLAQDLQREILGAGNFTPKVAWAGSWVAWSPRMRNYNAACPGAYCFRGKHDILWLAPA